MAKPTGAKEQSDYGLVVDNATATYVYHSIPAYRQPPEYSDAGILEPRPTQMRVYCPTSATGTLEVTAQVGSPAAHGWSIASSATGWSAETECERIGTPKRFTAIPQAINSNKFGYYIVEVKIEPGGTPDTEVFGGAYIRQDCGQATGDAFGLRFFPPEIIAPDFPLTAYHIRLLIAATLNNLIYSAGMNCTIPACGEVPAPA